MKMQITAREQEILHLMAQGMSSKTIANELHLSFYTVQTHRKNILRKLNETNTVRALTAASTIGLLRASSLMNEAPLQPAY